MDSVLWTDCAYRFPELPAMEKKLRVSEEDIEEFHLVYAECARIAQPKFLFCQQDVTLLPNNRVQIGTMVFSSRMLHVNMEGVPSVYAYVITCGQELYTYSLSHTDPLLRFWIDSLAEEVLRAYNASAYTRLCQVAETKRLYSMNPGSLPDWPISQQKPLFALLGDVNGAIGVTLTDTFLMLPIKSASGLYFASDTEFVNCTYCARGHCPSRRAPFNAQEFSEKYGQ